MQSLNLRQSEDCADRDESFRVGDGFELVLNVFEDLLVVTNNPKRSSRRISMRVQSGE
jgi:hypothetical protein